MKPSTDPVAIEAALVLLLVKIKQGVEYPDAHTHCALLFNVDGDALTRAYDDYCQGDF